MPTTLLALPIYELPGVEGKELILNLILYGMGLVLLLSVLWVLRPFADRGRKSRKESAHCAAGNEDRAASGLRRP